jgi:hypothetical protein
MSPIHNASRRRATILVLAFLSSFFFVFQTAQAGMQQQHEKATPTTEVSIEGTPALLLTPLPTTTAGEGKSSPRALLLTVALLMCGMIGMLIVGIGIAMVMVRVRSRAKKE